MSRRNPLTREEIVALLAAMDGAAFKPEDITSAYEKLKLQLRRMDNAAQEATRKSRRRLN